MNIKELNELINSLCKIKDKNLIKFYKKKRKSLVEQISKSINYNLKQLQ
jgi:hypothetical protein